MKAKLILPFLMLACFLAKAQTDLEQRLTQKVIDCEDIALNSSNAFIDYLKADYLDSAKMVIDFWEGKCGFTEPVMRAKILWTIIAVELTESVYDINIMLIINNYLDRKEYTSKRGYESFPNSDMAAYFGFVPLNGYFDNSVQEIAGIIGEYDNPLERLFCLLYSGNIDEFFYTLQTPEFSHYLLRYTYDNQVNTIRKLPSLHYSLFGGAYIPTGNATLLGSHPEFGFSIGVKKEMITYDLRFAFRTGSTDTPYHYVLSNHSTVASTYYFGGFIGLDILYDLLDKERDNLLLLGGLAIDGFDMAEYDYNSYYYGETYSIISFNVNLGLSYRHFISPTTYLFVAYRYNIVNYNNNMSTYDYGGVVEDISGNWHSISAGIGGVLNKPAQNRLKRLRYKSSY